jgi:rare lipoprotein A
LQIGPLKTEEQASQLSSKLSKIGVRNTQFVADAGQM